ncbi:DUF721 domain-containing protein [Polluticaenibacter yanchengensis]|uniref:DUF721 domain-containing protein n=1 Tax=Polluticaenibacter yanchengensis TaxID=3014562 RepID=A0ABT4ULJ3_9BACT|nr:DUF721 domain-containing protein [Chitinophagaceae bacterium LY-5]
MATASMGEALKAYLEKSKLKYGMRTQEISEVWEQIMGKTIAKYTKKIQIANKKLIITTPVAPLKQEIKYQKPQIIQRINEHFGEEVITDVIVY